MTHVKEAVMAVVGFVIATTVAHCNAGCQLPAVDASDAYRVELAKCVTDAKTREEADACRAEVNKKYNVCEGEWPKLQPCK